MHKGLLEQNLKLLTLEYQNRFDKAQFMEFKKYLDGVAPLIAYTHPAKSTTMHSTLVCQDRILCLGKPVYLPGLAY